MMPWFIRCTSFLSIIYILLDIDLHRHCVVFISLCLFYTVLMLFYYFYFTTFLQIFIDQKNNYNVVFICKYFMLFIYANVLICTFFIIKNQYYEILHFHLRQILPPSHLWSLITSYSNIKSEMFTQIVAIQI